MSDLPVNVDTTYDDDASDASVKLHQQHHDSIHALYNDISGATPDLSNLGIQGELAEGAFVDGDKTKLNGIEALADVTDAANVDAAGAVMNSDTSTAAMSFVVDEDTMSSDSATKVPTQQSVKAYVDATSGVQSFSVLATEPAYSHVNWTTFALSSTAHYGFNRSSSTAQNDEIVFALPGETVEGIWSLVLVHFPSSTKGIYTIAATADPTGSWTDVTTIDGYSASAGPSARTMVTGVTVPAGSKFIRLKMATKNASSSNYTGQINSISGVRTGPLP